MDTSLPEINKKQNYFFGELLKENIEPNTLVKAYDDVKQKIAIVSTFIKESVQDEDDVDQWEMVTPLPLLFETMNSLLQIKKNIGNILMDPKTLAMKRIKFTQTEKMLFAAYIAQVELCRKDLKNTHGIFIDPMEYC